VDLQDMLAPGLVRRADIDQLVEPPGAQKGRIDLDQMRKKEKAPASPATSR